MTFSEYQAKNAGQDPLKVYQGYQDDLATEMLANGEWDDDAFEEIKSKLYNHAVENKVDLGDDPEKTFFSRPDDDLHTLSNYGEGPAREAAIKLKVAREAGGTPDIEDIERSYSSAATPDEVNLARKKALDYGVTPFAVFKDAEGRQRIEVSPELEGASDEMLAQTFKSNPSLDRNLIPEIRRQIRRQIRPVEGYTASPAKLARSDDFRAAVGAVFANDKYVNQTFNSLREAADKGMEGNLTPKIEQIDVALSAAGLNKEFPNAEERKQFLHDMVLSASSPEVDQTNIDKNLRVLSTGEVRLPPGVLLNKNLFEKTLNESKLIPEQQKEQLRDTRDTRMEAYAQQVFPIIQANRSEFAKFLTDKKNSGATNGQVLDEWMSNPENHSTLRDYAGGIGESIVEGVGGLVLYPAALLGNKAATKAVADLQKSDQERRAYAQLFGKNLGAAYDLSRLVAPVAADVGVSLLTAGAATGAVAAKTGLKASIKAGLANSLKSETKSLLRDFTLNRAAKTLGTTAGEAAKLGADDVLKLAGQDIAQTLTKSATTASYLGTAFNRSAGSTYVQLYSTLADQKNPDGTPKHTPEQVREIALNHGLIAGLSTAIVTGAFSFAGKAGMESVYNGMSGKQLNGVLDRVKSSWNKLDPAVREGMDISNPEQFLAKQISKAARPVLKSLGKDALDEGMEEFTDQVFQSINQAKAEGKDFDLTGTVKEALYAGMLGAAMGGAVPGVREAFGSSKPSADLEAAARSQLFNETADKLHAKGASRTAEVFRKFAASGLPEAKAPAQEVVPEGAGPQGAVAAPGGEEVAGAGAEQTPLTDGGLSNEDAILAETGVSDNLVRPEILLRQEDGEGDSTSQRGGGPTTGGNLLATDQVSLTRAPGTITEADQLAEREGEPVERVTLSDGLGTAEGFVDTDGALVLTQADAKARGTDFLGRVVAESPSPVIRIPNPSPHNQESLTRLVNAGVLTPSEGNPAEFTINNYEAPPLQAESQEAPAAPASELGAQSDALQRENTGGDRGDAGVGSSEKGAVANAAAPAQGGAGAVMTVGDPVPAVPKSNKPAAPAALKPGDPITFTSSVPGTQTPTQGTVDRIENGKVYARAGNRVYPNAKVVVQEAPAPLASEVSTEDIFHKVPADAPLDRDSYERLVEVVTSDAPEQALQQVGRRKVVDTWLQAKGINTEGLNDADRAILTQGMKGDPNVRALTGQVSEDAPAPQSTVESELNRHNFSQGTDAFLQSVAKSGPPHLRAVAKLLLKYPEVGQNTPVTLTDMPGAGFAGAYIPSTRQILVNTAVPGPRGAVDTVMHELLHAATVHAIENPTEAQAKIIKRLDRIRENAFKKASLTGDPELIYGLSSLDELISHFFTSTKFREDVARLTPKSDKNWAKVILEAIVELVTGRAPNVSSNVMDDLVTFLDSAASSLPPSGGSHLRLQPALDRAYQIAVKQGDREAANALVGFAARNSPIALELRTDVSDYLNGRGSVRSVKPGVFLTGYKLKVLDAVIRAVPVDVVDVFGSEQRAAEMLFHDPSVFIDTLAANTNGSVTGLQTGRLRDLAGELVASIGAELPLVDRGGRNREVVSALSAFRDKMVEASQPSLLGSGLPRRVAISSGDTKAGLATKAPPTKRNSRDAFPEELAAGLAGQVNPMALASHATESPSAFQFLPPALGEPEVFAASRTGAGNSLGQGAALDAAKFGFPSPGNDRANGVRTTTELAGEDDIGHVGVNNPLGYAPQEKSLAERFSPDLTPPKSDSRPQPDSSVQPDFTSPDSLKSYVESIAPGVNLDTDALAAELDDMSPLAQEDAVHAMVNRELAHQAGVEAVRAYDSRRILPTEDSERTPARSEGGGLHYAIEHDTMARDAPASGERNLGGAMGPEVQSLGGTSVEGGEVRGGSGTEGTNSEGDTATTLPRSEEAPLKSQFRNVVTGNVNPRDAARLRTNPEAMQQWIAYLKAAIDKMWSQLQTRFDFRTAVGHDRAVRELGRAEDGYRVRSGVKDFNPENPGETGNMVEPTIRLQKSETAPKYEHTNFVDVRHGDKMFESTEKDLAEMKGIRGWMKRMFAMRDDMRPALSNAKLSKKENQAVIQSKLEKAHRYYKDALSENPDTDTVKLAMGNTAPLLTDSEQTRIDQEYQAKLDQAEATEKEVMKKARDERDKALRRKDSKDSKKDVQDTFEEAERKAKADHIEAVDDANEWVREEVTRSKTKEAAERRRVQSLAMQQLEVNYPKTYTWVNYMRSTITEFQDRLSEWYGVSNPDLAATIDQSRNVYLTRFYRMHSDPAMAELVLHSPEAKELRDSVIAFFKKDLVNSEVEAMKQQPLYANTPEKDMVDAVSQDPEIDAQAKKMFEDFIISNEVGHKSAFASANNIKTEVQRFMQKKNIPEKLREALGEETDPLMVAERTLMSLSNILFNQKMLESVRDEGLKSGKIISEAEKQGSTKYRDWQALDPSGVHAKHSPLAGYYASPEDAEAFKAAFTSAGLGAKDTADRAMDFMNRMILRSAGVSLATMVLGSPGAYTRNAVGSAIMAFAQGVNPVGSNARKSIKTTWDKVWSKDGDSQFMEEMIALGVLGNGTNIEYLRSFLNRYKENPMKALEWAQEHGIKLNEKTLATLSHAKDGWVKLVETLGSAAEFTETMQNVAVYLNELEVLMDSGLYTELQAKQEAARRVKFVMPSKSETPQAIDKATKHPFAALVAPFINFKTQMFRTVTNTYRLAWQDLQSDNQVIRNHGIQRMAHAIATHGVMTVAMPLIFQAIAGISDEEDRAIRKALPAYSRNSNFFIQRNDDGSLRLWDFTFTNPNSLVFDPATQIIRSIMGGNVEDIPQIVQRFATEEILGENVVAGKAMDVARNTDETTGMPLWLESDDFSDKIGKGIKHVVGGAYTPAAVKKIYQSYLATQRPAKEDDSFYYTPAGIMLGSVLPTKPRDLKPEDAAYRAFRNMAKSNSELWQITNSLSNPAGMAPGEAEKIYNERVDAQVKVWGDIHRTYKAFRELGIPKRQALSIMTEAGLSKDRSLKAMRGVTDRPVIPNEKLSDIREIDPARHDEVVRAMRKHAKVIDLR